MFVFVEFINAMILLVEGVYTVLYWLLFARIVVTWLPVDPYSPVVQFLTQVTEPILAPFRRLPLQIGMLDLSPIVAFVAMTFLKNVVVRLLSIAAYSLSGTGA